MSEQSLDLRSALSTLRRRRRTLTSIAVLGAVAGVVFVMVRPPAYASTALVLLPPSLQSSSQPVEHETSTDVHIATSTAVLGPAGASMRPRLSVKEVERRVEVTAPTRDLLQIQARAESADLAQKLTQAVAEAEVRFVATGRRQLRNAERVALSERRMQLAASLETVNEELQKSMARKEGQDPDSPAGTAEAIAFSQLAAQQANLVLQMDRLRDQEEQTKVGGPASIVQAATPARRPGLVLQYVGFGMAGAAAALTLAAAVLLARGRRDPRLRYRDEIADAVGSPVIGSVRSVTPRTVAGWRSLLADYAPGSVDAWALRQVLRQLVLGESELGSNRLGNENGPSQIPATITVISLSADPRGMALGPQMASYAASAGVPTQLVPRGRHETADALWAAFPSSGLDEVRPGLFTGTHVDETGEVALRVVLAVVDRHKPQLHALPETSATILAVSSGSATAEDLARVAVTADDAGNRISGVLVADPDSLDRTSGHLLQHERIHQPSLPRRLTGISPMPDEVASVRNRRQG